MAARVIEESAQRVSDGVTELLRKQPFFGSLALRLPLRADPSRETLASDGHEIRYSPRWVAATDAHVIETAMARVVMACALKHHTRRGERDPERWQLASQLVTHALIRDAGFTLPTDAEALDGVSVEEAYDRLPEPREDESGGDGEPPPAGGTMGAAAAGQPSGAGDGDDDSSDQPTDTPDGPGDDDDSGAPGDGDGQGQDGSDDDGRHGDGMSDAPASHDPSGTGEIMDAGARGGDAGEAESPVDVTAEEQAWDEAMHQAMNLARAEGKLPGGVEETVRNAHASTLDWRTRVVLAAPDRDTAQWSADSLGRAEVEEVAEGFSYGANTIRDGVSLTPKRELRALALASEIMRLPNLSGYLRFPGPLPVATIELDYVKRPAAAERFVPREGAPVQGALELPTPEKAPETADAPAPVTPPDTAVAEPRDTAASAETPSSTGTSEPAADAPGEAPERQAAPLPVDAPPSPDGPAPEETSESPDDAPSDPVDPKADPGAAEKTPARPRPGVSI